MLFFAVLLIIISYLAFLAIWHPSCNINILYYHSKLPGEPVRYKILGNGIEFATVPEKTVKLSLDWANKYFIYGVRFLFFSSVIIANAADAEVILSNFSHHKKGIAYKILEDWLQKGLLTSEGTLWQQRRKLLTPVFHFNNLQHYVKIFNKQTQCLVKSLKKECDKSYIVIHKHIEEYTLKTIIQSTTGTFTAQNEKKYKQKVCEYANIFFYRITHMHLIANFVFMFHPLFYKKNKVVKDLHKFTSEVIAERKKNFQEIDLLSESEADIVDLNKKNFAMLDLLLMNKIKDNIIDDKGIQEEIDTFIFEGHDTTSAGLQFTLMLLACHKDVQEKVYEEMLNVLTNVLKKPTYVELKKMHYLERVVKESLRLYPSVPIISRVLGSNVTTPSGYFLPKGTIAAIHIFAINRNSTDFPDPEKFDPDRFLPENCRNRHPFAYLSFSAGSRNCIGQKFAMLELKAAVCRIVANFVLEPVDTPETIVLVTDVVLRTKEHIRIKFVCRQQ